ncbi:MAG: ATP-binding protein [Pseudodesulfovibrio sp.]|uniref:histidine kinase n=1 Tax=Pseudodesulfovibrio indicus TaxID=1716143 RepID=A0A126QSB3_9BACT|nr:PAS domain-containing sensor histidine kinase [Pseudodesulfovibrio indicus]AMK12637.1 histidine kinase [Pseudodesulfovibrio indicus]TDT90949.1 two-component system NtrC family sensor kinase [Pseudodesulfovibrio indicus]
MSDVHYYKGLAKSMMFTIILVSFAPLFVVVLIAGYQYSVAYEEKVEAHLRELVLKHDQTINAYLEEKVAEIRVLAEVIDLGHLANPEGIEALHQALVQGHGTDFVDLGLIDDHGIQVAYSGPFQLQGVDYSGEEWFRAVQQHPVHVSDVGLGLRGVPHFIIALRMDAGGKRYVLRTTLDFIAFNRLVEDIRIGETGMAYILNRKGEFQTTPRRDMAAEVPFLKGMAESMAESGDRAAMTIMDNPATGLETIFVTSPIKGGDWLMVYQQDTADAFATLNRSRNLAIFILFIGGVAITAMAVLTSRRMARKVQKADAAKDIMNDQVIEAGKLASVGELAAGIAHEINNPVAIMVEEAGWIQDLLEEGLSKSDNEREVQRALNQIRTQGARCKEITHKLLSFARKIDPTVMSFDLNELVLEIVELSQQRAKYANVIIETSLGDGIAPVKASPSEMQQVFLNLVNNAIDAMDSGGGDLDVITRQEGDVVAISISDTGCGIPQANLSRIFDPFFTTKPVGKGTGLGLSIIYGIINKMGGTISVSSAVGEGTTFTIRLPAGRVDDTDTEEAA